MFWRDYFEYCHYICIRITQRLLYVLEWRTVSALTRGLFGVYIPSCEARREINTKNNARASTETIRYEKTYIIQFLARHNESINTINRRSLRVVPMSHLLDFCSADDITIDADDVTSQLPDNCDAITWVVIFNPLDIDFVQGDIHGLSCKNCRYMTYLQTLSTSAQGWGLLSQFPPFRYFPNCSTMPKNMLTIEYNVYIWQVSPQLSCGGTCQI